METSKNDLGYEYIFEEYIAEAEKNVLNERIDIFLEAVHNYEQIDVYEILILKQYLVCIKEKKEYYFQKQHERYDRMVLKPLLKRFIVLLLFLILMYCLFKYYRVPKTEEMAALIEKLKSYGITVKECSRRYYGDTEYWLEFNATERYLPHDEYVVAKNLIDRINKLHSTLNVSIKWMLIFLGAGAAYAVDMIYPYMRRWYNPRYKERFENFLVLEKRVEDRIAQIQQR